MRKDYPEIGDLVIGTIESVKDYGAFVDLDEYPGKKGFIHVSEVASGWIKYIRDYVREGQKVVCQVINIDREKGHIDLSLKRVNEHQRREKVQEWKNEQKARKLLEIVKQRSGDLDIERLAEDLENSYGTLYAAFETASYDPEAFERENEGNWVTHFIDVAKENIQPPEVKISGFVEISLNSKDAIDHIKEALMSIHRPEDGITVQYTGAPRYRIVVVAPDYKTAEEKLRDAATKVVKNIKEKGGNAEFIRKVE
ncbi:MAG: translation initiation factor IF-2 subunit alpha [Thermoplasmata archaeon]|jgi:translation initiation factor 2 subunit 1|nr:translation initiation factor IF-2 subunit alpha [Euryarchaeota archaeon]MVT14575.1 translation initiation factor IF-2 subunit alpha [Euryarchaeota archaeon]MVT35639.1 translation initiation factor IF-2 subunit alpha [Euryarchaeota archaeon]